MNEKSSLRLRLLAARAAALTDPSHLRERLASLLDAAGPEVVAAYVPFGDEPGGEDLPDFLAQRVPTVLLPVLRPDNDLDWAVYEGVLEKRRVFEPPGPLLGVDAIARAELIIVPALAVDQRGYRLGRGGGSYDRALTRASADAKIVALLNDGELLPHVPHEAHDRRVHVALTPSARTELDR